MPCPHLPVAQTTSHLDESLRRPCEQSRAGRRLNRQGATGMPTTKKTAPKKWRLARQRPASFRRGRRNCEAAAAAAAGLRGERRPATGLGAPSTRSPRVTAAKGDKERTKERQEIEGTAMFGSLCTNRLGRKSNIATPVSLGLRRRLTVPPGLVPCRSRCTVTGRRHITNSVHLALL